MTAPGVIYEQTVFPCKLIYENELSARVGDWYDIWRKYVNIIVPIEVCQEGLAQTELREMCLSTVSI